MGSSRDKLLGAMSNHGKQRAPPKRKRAMWQRSLGKKCHRAGRRHASNASKRPKKPFFGKFSAFGDSPHAIVRFVGCSFPVFLPPLLFLSHIRSPFPSRFPFPVPFPFGLWRNFQEVFNGKRLFIVQKDVWKSNVSWCAMGNAVFK